MSDYISRDDLIDTLDECIDKCEQMLPITPAQVHEIRGEINATKAIRVLVKMFDAADVRENKQGEYVFSQSKDALVCSLCGAYRPPYVCGANYCPNCGADMRPSDGDD